MSYPLQRFGLGDTSPTGNAPQPQAATLFGLNASTWLLVLLAGAAAYYLWQRSEYSGAGYSRKRGYDEIGNKALSGDKLFLVDYMSPDEEYGITKEVFGANKTHAIARMKEWAKAEGEPMKGASWDADEV